MDEVKQAKRVHLDESEKEEIIRYLLHQESLGKDVSEYDDQEITLYANLLFVSTNCFYQVWTEFIESKNNFSSKNAENAENATDNIFPVDAFPNDIQLIINQLNNTLNYPTDFTGASFLYAASLSIGNTYQAKVKGNWYESPNLFMAIVGAPGTIKSHPLQTGIQPIIERDKATYREYEIKNQEFKKDAALSKKEREKLGIDDPKKPVWKKFIVSDFTPEALVEIHKFNSRSVGVYCDELASWIKNFNRYNSGSEQEVWLSIWSGKMLSIDRKGGDPVFIPKPFISVIGTIQPGVLNEIGKNGRAQNGFIDRILFAFPSNLKKEYWNDKELDPSILNDWNRIITNLMDLNLDYDDTLNPSPKTIGFTPEAKKELSNWERSNTDKCNAAENEAIASIFSKLDIYAVRLSLILQLLRWSCSEDEKQAIGIEAVKGAILLVEYFRKTALKAYAIISNYNPLDKLPLDKKKVYEALPKTFITKEGLQVAAKLNFPERTFKDFLNEKEYFRKLGYGKYEKIIQTK